MRAARIKAPQTLELLDIPIPAPEEGQCLVRAECLSLCGSDIRRAYRPVLPEESYPLPVGYACHEVAGVVVESRTPQMPEGQRVLVLPTALSGLKEYLAEGSQCIIPLPSTGDLTDWVTCQPMGTVLHACQRMGGVVGKRVVVVGQGPIGLTFTMFLKRLGAGQIIVADLLDYRLEKARALGATDTINPQRDDPIQAVAEVTHGGMADVVVEACGEPDGLNQAIYLARKMGILGFFGVPTEPRFPIDHVAILDRGLTILVTVATRSGHAPQAVREMVRLVEQGWVDPSVLITHRLPFEEVQRAYDLYANPTDGSLKIVMSM